MPTKLTKGKRQLKIAEKYFPRTFNQYKIFPKINLAGKWLQEIGFECGKTVTVKYRKGKIVIEL